MKKSSILRKAILERRAVVVPGCHDALSAKVIEKAGFEAVQVSGFGLAGSFLSEPDVGLMQMKDILDITANIVQAVDIPVMEGKIRAAVTVRNAFDSDFVINARTDAYAVEGFEAAIERCNRYLEAGADLAFIDGIHTRAEIEIAVQRLRGPLSVNLTDGIIGVRTELIPIPELAIMGVGRVKSIDSDCFDFSYPPCSYRIFHSPKNLTNWDFAWTNSMNLSLRRVHGICRHKCISRNGESLFATLYFRE